MTMRYAEVIGDPIAHSKSPLIQNFWLDKLGLSARYERCHVTGDALADYIVRRRADPAWQGCNVTIPHKRAVMTLIDELDPIARKIGAVNTVARTGGRLTGYNSDSAGFIEPLLPMLEERRTPRMAWIIGSGGAARAVAHALFGHGFTIALVARDVAKARALLAEVDPDASPAMAQSLESWARPADHLPHDRAGALNLVVNATSLGMSGYPALEIDFSHVPAGAVVYDIVYAPLETPLLAAARERGLKAIDGLEMLVGQAAIAFAHFFGQPAPRAHDAELRALLTA